MPQWLSLFVLAFAVSLDGFGVGAMYGLRKIKIPTVSIFIIAAMSGFVIFGAMHIGLLAARFFPPVWAKMAGAAILIAIGIWALYQMMAQRGEEEGASETTAPEPANPPEWGEQAKRTVLSIELKQLGLVIQILKTPAAADMDRSGNISASEAALLGLALSLDAFGAGIGAALIGFSPVWTSIVIAMASGSFLYLGLRVGLLYSNLKWIRRLSFLPGCILILIGLLKMV